MMHATYARRLIFFLSMFAFMSCSTVLGPPEFGDEPMFLPPDDTPVLYDSLVRGQPNMRLISTREGFYIWKIGDSWHVRVVRKDHPHRRFDPYPHVMAGSISVVNGIILNLHERNLDPVSTVSLRRNSIIFSFESVDNFETRDNMEGFDFRIRPIESKLCVTLDVRVDGAFRPGLVRLGSSMYIPEILPLTMCFY